MTSNSEPHVFSIQIAADAGAKMVSLGEVHAVPGRGLEGDRYFKGTGTYSQTPGTGREVTLIEAEAIAALERDYHLKIEFKDARRNIVTRHAALNHFAGLEFQVGDVLMRGMRLCEPCSHLDQLAGEKISRGLVRRGGLRAEILSEGTIRVGDLVRRADPRR